MSVLVIPECAAAVYKVMMDRDGWALISQGVFGNSFIANVNLLFSIWTHVRSVSFLVVFFPPERAGECHDTAEEAAARIGAHEAAVFGSRGEGSCQEWETWAPGHPQRAEQVDATTITKKNPKQHKPNQQ